MKRWKVFVIVLVFLFGGCATPAAVRNAIAVAAEANDASLGIVNVALDAIDETFVHVKANIVTEAKSIIDKQASDGTVTADFAKRGMDALLAQIDEASAKHARWAEVKRIAMENHANAKESLFLADDLVMRSAATATELRDALTEIKAKIEGGSGE